MTTTTLQPIEAQIPSRPNLVERTVGYLKNHKVEVLMATALAAKVALLIAGIVSGFALPIIIGYAIASALFFTSLFIMKNRVSQPLPIEQADAPKLPFKKTIEPDPQLILPPSQPTPQPASPPPEPTSSLDHVPATTDQFEIKLDGADLDADEEVVAIPEETQPQPAPSLKIDEEPPVRHEFASHNQPWISLSGAIKAVALTSVAFAGAYYWGYLPSMQTLVGAALKARNWILF